MDRSSFDEILRRETQPEALEASCDYLVVQLRKFLGAGEPVLIALPNGGEDSLAGLFSRAVEKSGAVPIRWEQDYRWKELLRLAFQTRAKTIIGHPLVMLGLSKLSKATGTPLRARNVVLAGSLHGDWISDFIQKGLDCRIYSCYAVRDSAVIAGFSCSSMWGIHVREDVFEAAAVDEMGNPVPNSTSGRLHLVYRKAPELTLEPEEMTLLGHRKCACGFDGGRIVQTRYSDQNDPLKPVLEDQLLNWSSILDFRAENTECGLHLELVHFVGECLPRIHSCAKLTLRPWNPNADMPFCIQNPAPKNPE